MRVLRPAVPFLAIALSLAAVSLSSARAPDVRIAELKCNGDPELVAVENAGDEAQQLSGWQLRSDEAGEVFDLGVLGGLQPGASIFIQAGPSATGVFRWGTEFVFRDDDPSDFARIVDNSGATVHQVNCGSEIPAEPSPTATTADGVPNGGGAPPLPDGSATSLALIAAGVGLALAGALLLVLLNLRRRTIAVATVATPPPPPPTSAPALASRLLPVPVRPPQPVDRRAVQAAAAVTALGLIVAVAFLLFRARD